MSYDQAQSARLGQRVPIENPGVLIVASTDDVEAPAKGRLIYIAGDGLKLYDGTDWVDV